MSKVSCHPVSGQYWELTDWGSSFTGSRAELAGRAKALELVKLGSQWVNVKVGLIRISNPRARYLLLRGAKRVE